MSSTNTEKLYRTAPRVRVHQRYPAEPEPLSPLAKFATIVSAAVLSWLVTLGLFYGAYLLLTGF